MHNEMPYSIRLLEGDELTNKLYYIAYGDWIRENLGESKYKKTWYMYPLDPSGAVTRDFMYLFKNESDFVMFCLKFGQYRSNDTATMWMTS